MITLMRQLLLHGLDQTLHQVKAVGHLFRPWPLERITKHVQARAHRKTFKSVFRRLTAKERRALDRLLVIAVDQRRTAL